MCKLWLLLPQQTAVAEDGRKQQNCVQYRVSGQIQGGTWIQCLKNKTKPNPCICLNVYEMLEGFEFAASLPSDMGIAAFVRCFLCKFRFIYLYSTFQTVGVTQGAVHIRNNFRNTWKYQILDVAEGPGVFKVWPCGPPLTFWMTMGSLLCYLTTQTLNNCQDSQIWLFEQTTPNT